MIYLTGASNAAVRRVARERGVGVLVTPETKHLAGHIGDYAAWAVDNGIFGLAKRGVAETFDVEGYLGWLDTLPRTALFVCAPDVLHFIDGHPVGDAAATLERSAPILPRLRAMGFRTALVGQDGMEGMLDRIPWPEIDVIFLGGSDDWKLGPGARALAREARKRGKRVHMGRVNSYRRLRYADDIGCDSVDGTFLLFAPDLNLPRMLAWLERLAAAPRLPMEVT